MSTVKEFIGNINFLSTTNVSNNSTGAIYVAGGLAVAQDSYIGGNMNVSGNITVSNITILGSTYSSSGPLIYSQWASYNQNIAYTTGNVGINTTSPSYTLDVNGMIHGTNILVTNSSITNLIGTLVSGTNLLMTNASIGTLSAGNMYLSGNVTIGGNLIVGGSVISVNVTSVNIIDNNISVGTLNISGNISAGSSIATIGTLLSTTITSTLVSSTNLLNTNLSVTNLVGTLISGSNLLMTNGTINNLLVTVGNLTVSGLISSSNVIHTNASVTNLVGTLISGTNLLMTNGTINNLLVTVGNLTVSGLISSSNVIHTNITTTSLISGATNTLGSIITTGGNVGIGAVNPQTLLNVSGGNFLLSAGNQTGRIIVQNNSTGTSIAGGGYQMIHDGGSAYLWNYENNPLYLSTNNGIKLTIAANGNVGIGNGTINPQTLLNVSGGNFLLSAGNQTARIIVQNNSTGTSIAGGGFQMVHDGLGAYLLNYENNALYIGTSNSIRVTILPSGYVGIGTTNPTFPVDISVNVRMLGTLIGTDAVYSGVLNAQAGIYASSGSVSGINSSSYKTVYSISDGTRGYITIIGNIAAPCMLMFFFEWTSGTTNASFTQIASSGSAQPGAPGIGSGGTVTLIAQLAGGNSLQLKTSSGSGSVNYTVTLM